MLFIAAMLFAFSPLPLTPLRRLIIFTLSISSLSFSPLIIDIFD